MKNHTLTVAMIRPDAPPSLSPGSAVNRLVPLDLRYCAALLEKKGYRTVELDGLVEPLPPQSLTNWAKVVQPFAALFSIRRFQHADMKRLFAMTAALKKGADIKIIASGPFPSFYPEAFLGEDRFDAVILGEPEAAIVNTMAAFAKGKKPSIAGVVTEPEQNKKPVFVKNVDDLPYPIRYPKDNTDYYCNYPLRMNKKAVWGSILAGRGCGQGCVFCSPFDRITFSTKVRPRKIKHIQQEAMALAAMGVNVLSFEDDDPTFNFERTEELTDALAGVKASYILHTRIDELSDSILRRLASSGCALIKMGVESGSPYIINRLKKGDGTTWREKTIHFTRKAKELGIVTCGLFIIGCAGETEKDLSKTQSLMHEADFDLIQIHYFTPYPGSPIYGKLTRELQADEAATLYHYDPETLSRISMSPLPSENIARWGKKLFRSYVLRPSFALNHLRNFGRYYLHNPDTFLRLAGGLQPSHSQNR